MSALSLLLAQASASEPVYSFWQVTISQAGLLRALVVVLVAIVLSFVLKRVFEGMAAKTGMGRPLLSVTFVALSRSTHLLLFALTVRALVPAAGSADAFSSSFDLSFGNWRSAVDKCASVLVVVACTMAVLHLVRVPVCWFKAYADKTESKLDDVLAPIFDNALKVLVVLGGVIQFVSVLTGSTPTQIIAPLAVGGLAVGLAAQDTIKNFFGSVMLIIDKPFTLGDVVNIGTHEGAVESLGLRSTRIRTPDGHLVTVPNGDLANRAIRNVTARPYIRQLFNVGVTYDTPPEKLEQAVSILKILLEDHEGLRPELPPRVHLNNLGAYSVDIQVIYWYHPADWWRFNAYHQRLTLEIMRRFEVAGISFAFPSQTIYHQATPAPAGSPPKLG